ncbi:hypothetical protein [Nesterenkonia sp. F]|uniref:variant leucine-rich repeat-containing protein n=1 Tax=Nesterenkonia sp. F TaxID=795955 RepID=UPI000255C82D|nr:hypothetical protein [Nesterenkonia sp. F]
MTFSYDDARRLASDPETDWDTLHWIAEEHPELRPAVAANPSTYPELLEALADLDDPAITAALMRRFNPEAAPSEDAERDDGAAGPNGTGGDGTESTGGTPEPAEAATAGPVAGDAAVSATPTPSTPDPAEADAETAAPAGTAAGAAAPRPDTDHGDDGSDGAEGPPPALQASTLVAGAGTGISTTTLQERARRRRSRAGLVLLAVVLPVIAVVAIGALVMVLLGDRGDPQAEPDGAAASESPSSSATSPEPTTSEEPSPSPTGPTLDELRTAVSELPQNSSCEDVTDDVDVFTAYAELAAEEDSWSAEDDELVQRTVEDLQAECGALQSAQVHQQLTDGSAAGIAAAAEDMGTEWIEIGYPADDTAELTSFITPSGNIRCEMGDRLRCSIVEHDFAAPDDCDDADLTTYQSTLRTTAASDCEDPVEESDREILIYGQTTANEYFACQSLRSKLSCWNQITGAGFNLSRSGHSTY